MVQFILTWCQPLTVIIFVIAGTCCLLLKPIQLNQGIINFLLGAINFFIFYGHKLFK